MSAGLKSSRGSFVTSSSSLEEERETSEKSGGSICCGEDFFYIFGWLKHGGNGEREFVCHSNSTHTV